MNDFYATTREAWIALLAALETPDSGYCDQDGRECKELVHRSISIGNPDDAVELVRELQRQPYWVYPTPDELKNAMFSTDYSLYEFTYGQRLFAAGSHGGQIDSFIIPLLRSHPKTTRAIAAIYDPTYDSGQQKRAVPIFLSLQFRLFDALELTCQVRSTDLFIGFPANVLQLRAIQHYVADVLGVAAGPLHCILNSVHFFMEYGPFVPTVTKVIKKGR